jgi:hypothetical protein
MCRVLTRSERYISLALTVIAFAQDAEELRAWWKEEKDRRAELGLSEEQEGVLIAACKTKAAEVGEPTKKPVKAKPKGKRALI